VTVGSTAFGCCVFNLCFLLGRVVWHTFPCNWLWTSPQPPPPHPKRPPNWVLVLKQCRAASTQRMWRHTGQTAVGNAFSFPWAFQHAHERSYCNDLVGFEVLTPVVMKSTIFWYITQCSPLKVNRRFRGTCRLHLRISREKYEPCHLLSRWLSFSAYSSLKMEAICSSETSVEFQRTTCRDIAKDSTLH
jgi:hypothetical protein